MFEYEDFDQIIADALLVRNAMRYLWQGDPELVTDEHWNAYTRIGEGLGGEEDE